MKILLSTVLACFVSGTFAQTNLTSDLNRFFEDYVVAGNVRYKNLVEDPSRLVSLRERIEDAPISTWSPNERKALLINAYNLFVIDAIRQSYPTPSPQEIPGFFTDKKFSLEGERYSLNEIERELLLKEFFDPRLHFALVCAAKSCPPLPSFAFSADELNAQLEAVSTSYLNQNQQMQIDTAAKKIYVNPIFKWYEADFLQAAPSIVDYINQFRREALPENYRLDYYTYDWQLNEFGTGRLGASEEIERQNPAAASIDLQRYTPGTLLRKGQIDITLFNSIYTETANDWQGEVFEGYRTTFATALLQMTFGAGNTGRFNWGFDLALRGVGRASSNTSYSAMSRAFTTANNDSSRFGIANLGPRVKWIPFASNNHFSIQSSLLFSPVQSPEGRSPGNGLSGLHWLEWNRVIWWNQFFYDHLFWRDQLQLFAEVDLLFRFKRARTNRNHVDIPVNLFLSYFPDKKWTLYLMTQYVPRFVGGNVYDDAGMDITQDFVIGGYYVASGGGLKYQFSPQLQLELLYTDFWASKNNGLGETFNLGIKYLVL